MPTTDLTPGTVTTLGQLRPGDVAEWADNYGKGAPKFVVQRHATYPGFGPCVDAAYDGGGGISEPCLSRPVRYIGRGRIEPARIVMEGEPNRVAELEETVKDYEADKKERWALTDAIRDDAKKALRNALGKERWDQFWGPELEALASVVYEVWRQRAELEAQARTLRDGCEQIAKHIASGDEDIAQYLAYDLIAATTPKEKP